MDSKDGFGYVRLKTSGIHLSEAALQRLFKDALYGDEPKEAQMFFEKKLIDEYEDDWAARRTAELMETTPPGAYEFHAGTVHLWTGRGGAVQIQIALEKEFLEFKKR